MRSKRSYKPPSDSLIMSVLLSAQSCDFKFSTVLQGEILYFLVGGDAIFTGLYLYRRGDR